MEKIDFECEDLFDFETSFYSLSALKKYRPALFKQLKESWEDERRFCREELAPLVLEEDRKHAQEPNYLSWELLRLAGKHGRLSGFIPRFMGGNARGGLGFSLINQEEQASVDTAFSGLMGGHGLGLCALMVSFNLRILTEVAEKIVEKEKKEKPYVIDCAITEPMAGSDVEEVELYPGAKLICQAKKVPAGAILNGRKVFISTGHMASDHVILMPFDLKDPVNSYACFLVPNDAKGFSLGRKERKMGQRAAPASELIFEDCFVPEERIVIDATRYSEGKFKGAFDSLLYSVLGITRTAVGAMSTGNARGSFERVLHLAKQTKYKGKTLLNQQWVQALLTNMYLNVMSARSVYLEAQFALLNNLEMPGMEMPSIINTRIANFLIKKLMKNRWWQKFLYSARVQEYLIKSLVELPQDQKARIQIMSSLAKVVGSDIAMENAHLAVEFLSRSGLRHDAGIEKVFRDAKLLQIFEGTNQLNRLNIFKNLIAQHYPEVQVF